MTKSQRARRPPAQAVCRCRPNRSGLLATERLGVKKDLAVPLRPHGGHIRAQGAGRTTETALAEHIVKSCRAQCGIAGQCAGNEVAKRVDQTRPWHRAR